MISLRGATVSYPVTDGERARVLRDVDLDVRPGTWTAVVGRNGSGKSTLLRALAGLVPLEDGRRSERGDGPVRVAMLLQDSDNQLVAASIRHELALSVPAPVPAAERATQMASAAERFVLRELIDRHPQELSGGEKQRVALATVWLETPDLLLLDEPTAYLDPDMKERCVAFARDAHARGAAVVWAMSDLADLTLADEVIVLDDGRVTFRGARADWEARPAEASAFRIEFKRHSAPAHAPGRDRIVHMAGVGFAYAGVPVLDNFDFEVVGGECVGVTGRNSAGKTTLLLLTAGVLSPATGAINRRFVSASASGRQHVLYLPQSPERLFFAETVAEEILFGLSRLGFDDEEALGRARAALETAGLDPGEFFTRSPFQLSLGEMRRVAMAIARALDPDLLLLDEPTACLDADGVRALCAVVAEFRSRRRTIVIASHHRAFLDAVCDRIVDLTSGGDQRSD